MKKFFVALGLAFLSIGSVAYAQSSLTYYDPDTETITQLNNLRIQSINSYLTPSTVTAVADGWSGGRAYTIEVSSQTILLQRNRTRLEMNQFQVGDKINVYGFLSAGSNSLEALIMRNLDYPRREVATQLTGLQVTSAPGATAPTTLSAQSSQYPYTAYTIEVSASTQILDTNRNVLRLNQIQSGDQINVYGMLSGLVMRASILRDLSRTGSSNNLQIETSSNLQATVGVWYEAEFKVTGGNQPYTIRSIGSDTIPGLTFSQGPNCPPGAYCAMYIADDRIFLRGTPTAPGTYRIVITAQDSCPEYQYCYDYYRQTRKEFMLTVTGSSTGGGAPVVESVTGPSYLYAGQNGVWSIRARDPEAGQLTYTVRWGDENVYYGYNTSSNNKIMMPPQTSTTATFNHAYAYRGMYTIVFTVTDAEGRSATSNLTVNIQ